MFVGKVLSLLFNMLCHSLPSKEQTCLNFKDPVTISSEFEAPQNKTCHCFHFFLLYLP